MTNMASTMIVSYRLLFITVAFALSFVSVANSTDAADDFSYASARVESCSGCSLNRLPDVKKFIFEDLPQYGENVEFKHIPGAIPELVLLNARGKELERHGLSKLTRKECNDLLVSKGFMRDKEEM
ncbi:selenoprotein M-like [Temnothorax curvispinosus]|uniref:Selenoprotein M n=1 Tax=Temnothorax curvispinosus TaxID=300111 RepID=A0A6J1QM75_9HYME|nr:selenoprotein M-like [Temnothorax curvispinosus]